MYLKEVEMEGPLKQQDTKKWRDVTPAQLADTYLFSSYPGNVSHSSYVVKIGLKSKLMIAFHVKHKQP